VIAANRPAFEGHYGATERAGGHHAEELQRAVLGMALAVVLVYLFLVINFRAGSTCSSC
jgi:hypothetical protein